MGYIDARIAFQRGMFNAEGREKIQHSRKLFIAAHGYQPPRNALGVFSNERIPVLPEVNDQVHRECYQLVLADKNQENPRQFPDGFVTSFFGVTREWMKGAYPEDFVRIKERMLQTKDIDYKILGDPYLHMIMPYLDEKNLDMFVKIGKLTFQQDLGFAPKGFWLPETAVNSTTLRVLFKNDYKFIVLSDHQIQSTEKNPMRVAIREGNTILGTMAVLHTDSGLSNRYSFSGDEDITYDANAFLHRDEFKGRQNVSVVSDLEFYGHHVKGKDEFLDHVLRPGNLASAGFSAMNVKEAVHDRTAPVTDIRENTSWSCFDGLGRWRGDNNCHCTGEYDDAKDYKRELRASIDRLGQEIDGRLDAMDPNWRDQFLRFFLVTKPAMYSHGDLRAETARLTRYIPLLRNSKGVILFLANLARWTAESSDAEFFAGHNRPEHRIGQLHHDEARKLVNLL